MDSLSLFFADCHINTFAPLGAVTFCITISADAPSGFSDPTALEVMEVSHPGNSSLSCLLPDSSKSQ
ncbi:Uncharacterised protein [Chlamydia trachomatis]|nr:Uncharacterised protein [Chlamydia trachomatis]